MFTRDKEPSRLEKAIERTQQELANEPVLSDEYAEILERMSKLHRMKTDETSSPVSKDTLAIIGANLLGILIIVKHEHLNVITTRAMNMIPKLGTRV
jgi:hypothetical protein